MTKSLLMLSIIGVLTMVSCKQEGSKTLEVPMTEAKIETAIAISIPKFSTKEIQQFADDYASYKTEIITATKVGDSAKMKELQVQAADWNKKTQEAAASLSDADAAKWATFIQDLTKAEMTK